MEKKRKMSNDKFVQLDPDTLADLYINRPSRKRVIIDTLLHTLDEMHRDVLEQVVEIKEKEGFPEANELIKYIKSK